MSVQEHFRGSSVSLYTYVCINVCVSIHLRTQTVFTSEKVRPVPSDPWETWSR